MTTWTRHVPRVCGGPGCAAPHAMQRFLSAVVAVYMWPWRGVRWTDHYKVAREVGRPFHGGEMRAEGTEICSTVGDLLALSGERSCIPILSIYSVWLALFLYVVVCPLEGGLGGEGFMGLFGIRRLDCRYR